MTRTPAPHPAVIWGVPLVAVAILVALLATGSNRAAFLALNRWTMATEGWPWPYLTVLGDTAVAISLLLPLAVQRPQLARALAVSAVLATLFVHGLKPQVALLRPPAVIPLGSITVLGPPYTTQSFPSGHTTTIFLAASLIWVHFANPWLRAIALALAVAVGLSRIMVGVHWPIDVAAGAAGGWLSGVLGTWLAARWPAGSSVEVHRLLILVGAIFPVALLFGLRTGYPMAWLLTYLIASSSLVALAMALYFRWQNRPEDNHAP